MGLAITVGIEHTFVGEDEEAVASYRARFTELSAELATKDVTWTEPPPAEVPASRASLTGFPYSTLHYLRRVAALQYLGDDVTPVPDGEKPDGEAEDEVSYDLSSHLICHSDGDGFYVPVDFSDPLFLDDHIVGSSHQLLAELEEVASPLGIEIDEENWLSDEEVRGIIETTSTSPYWREREAWLTLYEACRLSIETGHAIVFH